MNIQMVDLYGQYQKIKDEIDLAMQEVIRTSVFVKGGKVNEFEENLKEYLDVNHVISCGNGTDALQIAMMALDLEEGDEIITTPFTFVATLEVLALLKLKPVLVDVDINTFNIRPELVNNHINHKTKALVPVHLFGQCANMEEILKICLSLKMPARRWEPNIFSKMDRRPKLARLVILPVIHSFRLKIWEHLAMVVLYTQTTMIWRATCALLQTMA